MGVASGDFDNLRAGSQVKWARTPEFSIVETPLYQKQPVLLKNKSAQDEQRGRVVDGHL